MADCDFHTITMEELDAREKQRHDMALMLGIMQADALRLRNGACWLGDGIVIINGKMQPLSPEVAKLLREWPWPFGWSVIREPR